MPEGLVDVLVESPDELTAAAEGWIEDNPTVDRIRPRCIETTKKQYAEAIESAKTNFDYSESSNSVILAVETGVERGWMEAIAIEQCELVRLRSSAVAREKLEKFLSKG